ncbi:MAG: hypothetical protein GY739_00105 [Mesoflavibacter sp.]|nr:hypothetical protein [Mesoflavibacter sp.]
MNLEQKYKEETGFDVGKIHDIGTTYYSNDYVEWLEKQLLLHGVTPRFSVSLVYQDQNNNMLRTLVLDAKNKHEALGKTIKYFEEETKGLALVLKAVTHLNMC